MAENLETGGRVFGPHNRLDWSACNLAWVFAANSREALNDPDRRVHGYLRDIIRIEGTARPYIVRPRGKSGRSATAFAWVKEAEL